MKIEICTGRSGRLVWKIVHFEPEFKEIKPEYEKDEDMMKAHVLSGLPDDYSVLRTQLYTNRDATYNDYKIYIQGFWWTKLNGRKLTENDGSA